MTVKNGWSKVETPLGNEPATGGVPQTQAAGGNPEAIIKIKKPAKDGSNVTEVPGQEQADNGETVIRSAARYNKAGRRRGHHRMAAPLGLVVLLLAVTGVIALGVWGIGIIRAAQDDTKLHQELYDFLEPLMIYDPPAFADINKVEAGSDLDDTLILAALRPIMLKEIARQQNEGDECRYAQDEEGRMLIPLAEVNASYAALFGKNAKPHHHSIGQDDQSFSNMTYSEEQGGYYVPAFIDTTLHPSMYVPVLDTVKRKSDTYVVRIGYVPDSSIGVNDKLEQLEPKVEQAAKFQNYTVKKADTGWALMSIADEAAK